MPRVEENAVSEAEWFKHMASYLAKRRAQEKVLNDAMAALIPPEK